MTIINEIERLVIEFASLLGTEGKYPLSQETQVWLVCEQHSPETSPTWRILGHGISQAYSNISGICQKEAQEAEFGERLNMGKRVKAEDYIGLWRKAIGEAISISALPSKGMSLQCKITSSTQHLLAKEGVDKAVANVLICGPFLTAKDEHKCTWVLPLDSLEACQTYSALSSNRSYSDTYKAFWSEEVKLVLMPAKAKVKGPAYDLFSDLNASLEVTA